MKHTLVFTGVCLFAGISIAIASQGRGPHYDAPGSGTPGGGSFGGAASSNLDTNGYTIFDTPGDVTVNDQLGVATSVTAPVYYTAAANPGDAAAGFNLGSTESICWERTTPGTDSCIGPIVNNSGITVTGSLAATDDVGYYVGTGTDSAFIYSTAQTPDATQLTTGADSRAIIVIETADAAFDFAHPLQSNPTVFVHSANQSTTEWISMTHDATNGILDVGAGSVSVPDGIITPSVTSTTAAAATTGILRAANNEAVFCGRNAANSADVCVTVNAGNGLVVNSNAAYLQLQDNDFLLLGNTSSTDPILFYGTAQTADALMIGLNATDSNTMIITENADSGTNFALAAQTNPTIAIQSADATKTYQRALISYTGVVSQVGSKGATTTTGSGAESTVTCSGGGSATLTAASLVPDGAMLLGITTRITTALTGSTGFSVGDGSDADLFGVQAAATQGATTGNADATAQWGNPQLSAMSITLTFAGGNCTAGAIVINAHYTTIAAASQN